MNSPSIPAPIPFNFYIDDSGTKEYKPVYHRSGATRYFAFGGMLVSPFVAGELSTGLKKLKEGCFGTDAVEIKTNWLRIQHEREARYLTPFSLSEERLREFVDDVYRLISNCDCTLIGCVVDKVQVVEKYGPNAHYAPSISYDCLLQRVQHEMEYRSGLVTITIDDMNGATPKGNQFKKNLTEQHRRLRTHGSVLYKNFAYNRIGSMSFSDSKADERLQLVDFFAYAIYRQFVEYGHVWDGDTNSMPSYKYLQRLNDKLRKGPDGQFSGWGIVKFPMVRKRRWVNKK